MIGLGFDKNVLEAHSILLIRILFQMIYVGIVVEFEREYKYFLELLTTDGPLKSNLSVDVITFKGGRLASIFRLSTGLLS